MSGNVIVRLRTKYRQKQAPSKTDLLDRAKQPDLRTIKKKRLDIISFLGIWCESNRNTDLCKDCEEHTSNYPVTWLSSKRCCPVATRQWRGHNADKVMHTKRVTTGSGSGSLHLRPFSKWELLKLFPLRAFPYGMHNRGEQDKLIWTDCMVIIISPPPPGKLSRG